jgi:IclR family KDG regulon transcriptional repressor
MNRDSTAPTSRRNCFPEKRVPSVDRALNLLEMVELSEQGLTLSEVSRKLGIPPSSAHYLIRSLVMRGYLERKPCGRGYTLGLRAANFARLPSAKLLLKEFCSPFLQVLAEEVGLTAQVGVLDGAEALVIDRVQAADDIRLDCWVGRHFDLHCTALGKALIAHSPTEEVEKLFEGRALPRHNHRTIHSISGIWAQLAEVRERGYAIDDEEHELGVRCVAAPVFNYLGVTVAAVSVFSSVNKFANSRIGHIGKRVLEVGWEISRNLGDSPLMLPDLHPPGFSPKRIRY